MAALPVNGGSACAGRNGLQIPESRAAAAVAPRDCTGGCLRLGVVGLPFTAAPDVFWSVVSVELCSLACLSARPGLTDATLTLLSRQPRPRRQNGGRLRSTSRAGFLSELR